MRSRILSTLATITAVSVGVLAAPDAFTAADAVSVTATVTLTANPNPATAGQAVTLRAKVVDPVTPATSITGSMSFLDGTNVLATVPVTSGVASLSTRALAAGTHALSASFTDATITGLVSPTVTEAVAVASTATTVASTRPTANYGDSGNIVATVKAVAPGAGVPTGTIDFFVDGGWYESFPLDATGHARLPLTDLYPAYMPGAYTITASYSGDTNYAPSTSTAGVTQTLVGISSPPVSTLTLNAKGLPAFSPRSFTMSSWNPVGCNVTIQNNTPYAQALVYGTPGTWKRLPFGTIPAGGALGVGVSLAGYTGYFSTMANTANYVAIRCI